jgi:outer membrane protein assembly factor BamE (lipoprotein component of BamABCDE complex)
MKRYAIACLVLFCCSGCSATLSVGMKKDYYHGNDPNPYQTEVNLEFNKVLGDVKKTKQS